MSVNRDERGATVEFCDICRSFGAVEAVKDFSLTVNAGEFLTLLGPSGSGKTTVLNVVAGFLFPTSGEIYIGDKSIAALPTEKRNVGMVFQNYSLFPHMNVSNNVAFPLKMRHVRREVINERVDYALNLVHLRDYGSRMPHQLSGGERQRVAFARAIVFEPKVLLMDEPLGALDLKLREQMQIEIKHYQQQIGCTVIYVTHDQGEALTLSDRIVVMNLGEIVQIGDPEEIYDYPSTKFAAEFIGETNVMSIRSASGGTTGWRMEGIDTELPPEFGARLGGADKGLLSIRPEKIVRIRNGAGDWDQHIQFDAVVEEVVFLGDVIRYAAEFARDRALIFKEHRTGTTTTLKEGEPVRLGFLPSDAIVLDHD